MKKILITGKNSFVGNSFEKWLKQYPNKYIVDKISLKNETWDKIDFSKYDSVLHVAGIAHVSTNPKLEDLYYKVNRDLTIEVAQKAKFDGVKQFIFMSSIIVYGDATREVRVIDINTQPTPSNFYGRSKLEAENGILPLQDEQFKIAIIRPPMIYGKGSKGNYPKLSKIARLLPIFPDIENQRSMIHIDNLSEFLRLIIDNEDYGTFLPQNKEFVKTSEMVRLIAEVHGKKIRLVKVFNPIIKMMLGRIKIFDKVFGNIVYDNSLSKYKDDYIIWDFKKSIINTESISLERD